jgi:DNA replication protein DnaC
VSPRAPSGLPCRKGLAEFDVTFHLSISEKELHGLAGSAHLQRAGNLLLLGQPGVAKKHSETRSPAS